MGVYLSIDCVIGQMVLLGMIKKPKEWKRSASETKNYTIELWHVGNNSLILFKVSIIDGKHYIRSQSLLNQAVYFQWNVSVIIDLCKCSL